MPRFCDRCGRPLDAEHHEVGEKRWVVVRRGRGRMGLQRVTPYACKTRLVATSPVTGKTLTPSHPQRLLAAGGARYVHESRFEGDLKP